MKRGLHASSQLDDGRRARYRPAPASVMHSEGLRARELQDAVGVAVRDVDVAAAIGRHARGEESCP
jgi:hypothetical protein